MRWRGMTCALLFAGVLVFGIAGVIAYCSMRTEKTIERLGRIVEELGGKTPVSVFAGGTMEELPSPVRRYFTYVFRGEPRNVSWVRVEMAGQFRRPRTETFSRTTASQILAAGTPAFVFDATTPVVPGIWARAYDSFAEGRMEMKAKIASAFTVVDERETEALNRTSLRRWLLESPLCPRRCCLAVLSAGNPSMTTMHGPSSPVTDSRRRSSRRFGTMEAWNRSARRKTGISKHPITDRANTCREATIGWWRG